MSGDGGSAPLRPRLHTVTVTAEAQTVDVEVQLDLGGHPAQGTSSGAPTPFGTARAAALATLAALQEQVDNVRFGLDTLVDDGDPASPWVTVVVSMLTRTGVERLIGSALVEDGRPSAAVRAVLQACNRRMGHLLGDARGDASWADATVDGQRDAGAGALAGVVAHQLRGPATNLIGYLELLEAHFDSLDDTERRTMLDRSLDGGRRLLGRLENLLTMARSEGAAPIARRERVPVHETIRLALADVPGAADVEVRCDDDLHVHVDPDHLAQIVGNYVDNALRHGAPPVVVDARRDGPWVEVHVTDAGPGLEDHVLDGLFDRPGLASTATGGSGLGLHVARLLAEANGGAVDARPVSPRGLRATVRVPASEH